MEVIYYIHWLNRPHTVGIEFLEDDVTKLPGFSTLARTTRCPKAFSELFNIFWGRSGTGEEPFQVVGHLGFVELF